MQLDFHYYCVAVLARAAGFKSQDALDIAYASQYVDNATETGRVELQLPAGDGPAGGKILFDPVRTAYWGLETIHTVTWDAQKRVWIPFHFIPPEHFDPEDPTSFSFVTAKDSSFSRDLLEQAAAEPLDNHRRRLCRIGVALHTYADSWSHADFSGREEKSENNVESIHSWDSEIGDYVHLKIENTIFDTLPFIGHGEAGYFPDLAYEKWKFNVSSAGFLQRDNATRFLDAAKCIYDRLLAMDKADAGTVVGWDDIGPKIHELLASEGEKPAWVSSLTLPFYRAAQAQDVEERCEKWKEAFQDFFDTPAGYAYDKIAWRDAALENGTEWDTDYRRLTPDQELRGVTRTAQEGFWHSHWVHFHRAALLQRHYVLEHLP